MRIGSALAAFTLGLVIGLGPEAWPADLPSALEDHARAVDRIAKTPEGEARVVDRLSQDLGVPAETLRAERAQLAIGWGGLFIAHRLSQAVGIPVDSLVAQHRSGQGWGAIAKANHVDLGPTVSAAKAARESIERGDRSAGRGANEKAAETDKGRDGGRGGPAGAAAGNPGGGQGGGSGAGGAGGGAGGKK